MNCRIILTDEFTRRAKRLAKKYRSLKNDLGTLFEALKADPFQGDCIGDNIYKVRMAVKSKGRGKSGGARIINYLEVEIIEGEKNVDINVLTIYDKSELDSISNSHIRQIIDHLKEEE